MGKAWLIASGKGGVGKSTLSAGLGTALAKTGHSVCIIDGDIGLRDQDAILGVQDRVIYDLVDVANKDCRLQQALISPSGMPGIELLPASQFARSKELDPRAFGRIVTELKGNHDDVIIDCPAGIERGFRGLLKSDIDACILVCTPDDVCMRNAERASALIDKKGLPRAQVIVNRLIPGLIAQGEMYNAMTVAQTLDLPLLGEVPDDPNVYRSLLGHIPLVNVDCEARNAIWRIAQRMTGENVPLPAYGSEKPTWFQRLFRKKQMKEVKRLDC